MKNIFETKETQAVINRINSLSPTAQPLWGKMSVDQMLAHCNVTYEMTFEDIHPKPKGFTKLMLKLFVKNIVVGDKPYKRNSRTAPQFVISDTKNFVEEKARLTDYLWKAQGLGEQHFSGKESHSFGLLSTQEWNNMFYKHLDHHLNQFGV
ncbi:DUF1569 domain-containing protein [Algibacter amylolyticus]|uniref:DUF1569 domain-containing protein n=1 Tax=Algibacter amylolyticus TaxID=1608400 RepID=A0A5M7BEF3_9FLAO|nr:DUF1569 domain-containing protein [Algibacter amylolyticus]KAA5827330.1 DUF1569 domain-containing protein [Algibacter amylolyticus]MBB5266515.1 hypothetical protein [Algibacter amylolyticus]TSJ81575.1 DUF1569 domain-containing protein [Algibacter amylolyticus]